MSYWNLHFLRCRCKSKQANVLRWRCKSKQENEKRILHKITSIGIYNHIEHTKVNRLTNQVEFEDMRIYLQNKSTRWASNTRAIDSLIGSEKGKKGSRMHPAMKLS
jgi:hypothetical protein